jgi:hypothetical protein
MPCQPYCCAETVTIGHQVETELLQQGGGVSEREAQRTRRVQFSAAALSKLFNDAVINTMTSFGVGG